MSWVQPTSSKVVVACLNSKLLWSLPPTNAITTESGFGAIAKKIALADTTRTALQKLAGDSIKLWTFFFSPPSRPFDRHRTSRQCHRRRRSFEEVGCCPTCCALSHKARRWSYALPEATRPWQHVLEPLSGYLQLHDLEKDASFAESWNFGPGLEGNCTVEDVLHKLRSLGMPREVSTKPSPTKQASFTLTAPKPTTDWLGGLFGLLTKASAYTALWNQSLSYARKSSEP